MSNLADGDTGGTAAADRAAAPGSRIPLLRRALEALYFISGVLAAVSVAGIAALILAQVVARLVGQQVRGADDISGYFLAAGTFLALAPTFRRGEHIRVGLLLDCLSERWRRPAETAALAVTAALVGYFAYAAIDMTRLSYVLHDVAQGLVAIPLWIPQTTMAAGLAILFIALLDDLFVILAGGRPSYVVAADAVPAGTVVSFER